MTCNLHQLMILDHKIGSIPLRGLIEYFQFDLDKITDYLVENYKIEFSKRDEDFINKKMKYIKDKSIEIIPFNSEFYPSRLKNIFTSPIFFLV